MFTTNKSDEQLINKICVTRQELSELLGCGLATADKISKEANARLYVGKRCLISVDKIKTYIVNNAK